MTELKEALLATSATDEQSPAAFSRERLAGYEPRLMEEAVVLVVGAGALAQMLVTNLALPGVGELRIVDFDHFEPHNATRSPHYPSTPDEQRAWAMMKAATVAHKVRPQMLAERPAVRYANAAIQALGLGAFDGATVVVSAVDNPRARAYLSDACRLLGVPLVEGGFDGPATAMSCFPPTEDATRPCYRCGNPSLVGTFSCARYAIEAEKAGVIPAIQPASSVLAGLQAEAVIQAIHGEFPTAFKRTTVDVRSGRGLQYELAYNPHCEGEHRTLASSPATLPLTADAHVGALLEAVEEQCGRGVEIQLYEPFIVDATCMSCGDVVAVGASEWAYDRRPRCEACGGPWVSRGAPELGYSPTKPQVLSRAADPEALRFSCREAGLPPRAIFEARNGGGEALPYRLGGSLDDLYESVG